jgi:ABC-type glycerol-3-phosphate transport system substrate-binding protein
MTTTPYVSRRSFLAGGAAAAAALAIPGKSKFFSWDSTRDPQSTADDVLTIAFPLNSAKTAAQVNLALTAFKKASGITVHPIPMVGITSSDAWVSVFQELATRIASGAPTDSAYIPTEGMLLFESQGILEPLNPYIARDSATVNEFFNDVDPALLRKFRDLDDIDGNTFVLPIGYNVATVWYNRKVFKELNVPEPTPDWTWEEFESIAQKIAAPPNRYGFQIGTPAPNAFNDVYPWVLTNGGYILNPSQTACEAGSPAAIEAATFVRGSYNQFVEALAGRLGMFPGNMGADASIAAPQSVINETFGIVPWPRQTRSATCIGVGGFPMFKLSQNKPAMWEFIKYSISEEFQSTLIVPFADDMPIRTSVATSKEFLAGFPPGTHYYSDVLPETEFIVGVKNSSNVENEISTAWESILTGATSPAAGMKSMQSAINQLLATAV